MPPKKIKNLRLLIQFIEFERTVGMLEEALVQQEEMS